MNKSYQLFNQLYVFSLAAILLFGSANCGALKINAGDSVKNSHVNSSSTENAERPAKAGGEAEPAVAAKSFAGVYNFETYKPGEAGYVNSLTVSSEGSGLSVFFEATYVYPANGAETFKEASGGGKAVLRGSTATAEIFEDGGDEKNPCRLTIIFAAGQATVKESDDCYFNVALSGVYKKQAAAKSDKPTSVKSLREIEYSELRDFVNDFDRNRTGMQYVISNVPVNKIARNSRADSFGNKSYKGLFYLEAPEDDGDGSTGFLTSAQMIKALDATAESAAETLRVTAVLVQSDGNFDVYRLSFVTKIEGLGETGKTVWTATGAEPAKIKFQH